MKKVGTVLFAILLINILYITINSEDNHYKIKNLHIDIAIPDDYIVFTRDVTNEDPNLQYLVYNADELKKIFINGCIYLNAMYLSDTDVHEILVTMKNDKCYRDFISYNMEKLAEEGKKINIEEDGVKYTYLDVYATSNAKYIVLEYSGNVNNQQVSGIVYNTSCNGQSISIKILNYTGAITDTQKNKIRSIVDNVVFDRNNIVSPFAMKVIIGTLVGALIGVIVGIILLLSKKSKEKKVQSQDNVNNQNYSDEFAGKQDTEKRVSDILSEISNAKDEKIKEENLKDETLR
ncbi:MAG: hypothetical protein DBX47_06520 [Clostridiales bacterium]|nr:MAG: hypothetical protein DBX47_06520 [Clostridiales bacterium]